MHIYMHKQYGSIIPVNTALQHTHTPHTRTAYTIMQPLSMIEINWRTRAHHSSIRYGCILRYIYIWTAKMLNCFVIKQMVEWKIHMQIRVSLCLFDSALRSHKIAILLLFSKCLFNRANIYSVFFFCFMRVVCIILCTHSRMIIASGFCLDCNYSIEMLCFRVCIFSPPNTTTTTTKTNWKYCKELDSIFQFIYGFLLMKNEWREI